MMDLYHSSPQSTDEKGSFSFFIPVSSVVACKDSLLVKNKPSFFLKILPVNIKIQQWINKKSYPSEVFKTKLY